VRLLEEALEALREPFTVWPRGERARHSQRLRVKLLQQRQHRPILVIEQAARYVHVVIGIDTDDVVVEGAMMNRAQTDAVGDQRLPVLFSIRCDVNRVEQPQLLETASSVPSSWYRFCAKALLIESAAGPR
jgi:hypothetical protein